MADLIIGKISEAFFNNSNSIHTKNDSGFSNEIKAAIQKADDLE